MRILVTGGAGYIGSTLVPFLLNAGHKVRVVDALRIGGQSLLGFWSHPAFEFLRGDIRQQDVVRAAVADIDAVVHLAAVVGNSACARQPNLAREVNLEASLTLLDQCNRTKVSRYIFASTCCNYGKVKDPCLFVNEDSELRPASLYAETKVAIEKSMMARVPNGICLTPLRLATVFGVSPRMRFDLTVHEFTMSLLTTGRLSLAGGHRWRPYVHVGDVARAVRLVLESPSEKVNRRIFNVGDTTQNYQQEQLIELIRPYAGELEIEEAHSEATDGNYCDYRVSFSRIREELGFRIKRTVADGIAEVARLVRADVIRDYNSPEFRN